MYFQRIGASGFVLGRIRTAEAPRAPGLRLRYATVMDGMREVIDQRIRAVLPGDKGAIASALITGKRDAISRRIRADRISAEVSGSCEGDSQGQASGQQTTGIHAIHRYADMCAWIGGRAVEDVEPTMS